MNIALVLQHRLAAGIQRLIPGTAVLVQPLGQSLATTRHSPHTASLRNGGEAVDVPITMHAKAMPLRVLRVVESGQPRSCTGRLVISGRMADVCAELDRLVEREAALH
jgi:hypothetical protein